MSNAHEYPYGQQLIQVGSQSNYTLNNSFFFGIMGAILEGGGKFLIWYNLCWNMIENYRKDSSN